VTTAPPAAQLRAAAGGGCRSAVQVFSATRPSTRKPHCACEGSTAAVIPRLHLGFTSAPPRLHLGFTWAALRLHLGSTWATLRLHLGCTSATSRLHPRLEELEALLRQRPIVISVEYTNILGGSTVSCRVLGAPREYTRLRIPLNTAADSRVRLLSSASWDCSGPHPASRLLGPNSPSTSSASVPK